MTYALRAPTRFLRRDMLSRVLRYAVVGFVAFLVVGNLFILAAHAWAKWRSPEAALQIEGIDNFRVVDDRLWRGAAPDETGYAGLADAGARVIVDLRAEEGIEVPVLEGVDVHHLPIRDGQTPTEGQVQEFLAIVEQAPGPVFVHCGAGVGRTGAVVAAYLAATEQGSGGERVRHNLSVGPPSLEQIAYAASLEQHDYSRPNVAIVAASRVLDAPRRIFHRLGF